MLAISKTITIEAVNKLNVCNQQLRNIRFRKPPWVPRAKSKMFRVPPLKEKDLEETAYMMPIWHEYKAHMRSVYQLFKTEGKFSNQASQVAQEEHRKRVEQEKELLARNEQLNNQTLKYQLIDQEQQLELKKKQIEAELEKKKQHEQLLTKVAEEQLKRLKEKAAKFIDPNNLDYEIEKMLNERHDYNFAVDKSGNFFKGTYKTTNKTEVFDTKFVHQSKKASSDQEPSNETPPLI